MAQVNQDVQGALTQAGITNGDVAQNGNAIYVRLDENDLFKKNSTMITPMGQKVLDNIAQVVMSRSNVNVAVGAGDSAIGWVSTDKMSEGSAMTPEPVHHRVRHASHAASTTGNGSGNASAGTGGNSTATTATASSGSQTTTAPAHKKVHHHYSGEGSMAMSSSAMHSGNHSWGLKQARMVKVSDRFLQNGLPKIHLTLQRPPMNGTAPGTAIKIIITPNMKAMAQQNASAMSGTE
jgi:hypothetical protein